MNFNYTWSHCISDLNAASYVGTIGAGYNIADNRRYDRGSCAATTGTNFAQSLDRRHLVNLTGVLEAPKFSSRSIRLVASGWKLSASYLVSVGGLPKRHERN